MTVEYAIREGCTLGDFLNLRHLYEDNGFSLQELNLVAFRQGSTDPEDGLINLHSPLSSMSRRDEYNVMDRSKIQSLYYQHMNGKIDVPFLENHLENDYGSYMKMSNGEIDITMIANGRRGASIGRLALGIGSGLFVSNGMWFAAMAGPAAIRPFLFLTGLAMGSTCMIAGFHGARPVPSMITITIEALGGENHNLDALVRVTGQPKYL